METFADCMKRLRKAKGLKIYQLAEKVGASPEFFCMVEKGKKYPAISTLKKVASILGNELKGVYFKEHRPDILALMGEDLIKQTKGSAKPVARSRKTK